MLPVAAGMAAMNAGTTAATAGLGGAGMAAGAGAGAMSLLGPIGIGLFAAQALGAFGKKKSPKMYVPMLSPEGKATEANLQSTAKHQFYGDLMPINLTSLVVGQSKRSEGQRRRASDVTATGIGGQFGATEGSGMISGVDIAGIGGESTNRMLGGIGGENALVDLRQNEFRNSLNTLSNLRAMEMKQAPSNLQVPFMQQQFKAMNKGQKGRDIGQLMTMASMLAF